MRAIAVVMVLVISGCTPPPSGATALVVPKKTESSTEVIAYSSYDLGAAASRTELWYALGENLPSEVQLVPTFGTACETTLAPLKWTAINSIDGTAAAATLVDGSLHLSLVDEGVVTIFLDGSIQQTCGSLTEVPLRHRLIITVQRVVSYEVRHSEKSFPGCEGLVLPSGADLSLPIVNALTASGLPIVASNASHPVEMKLTSDSTLTLSGARFTASPGHVTIALTTSLPVTGLDSFDVVGPDAVTEMDAKLWVRMATSPRDFEFKSLENGMIYRFPNLGSQLPDAPNSVDVVGYRVSTSKGPLCMWPPASWFDAVTSTPGVCSRFSGGEVSQNHVPVLKIVDRGECHFKATVVLNTQQWSGNFTVQ